MAESKSAGQKLKDELLVNDKNGWEGMSATEKKNIFKFCDGYIDFLNVAKTEREAVKEAEAQAIKAGFKSRRGESMCEPTTFKPFSISSVPITARRIFLSLLI